MAKVLIACEYSGTVRNAFLAAGHDTYSCDIIQSDDNSPRHIIGDVKQLLSQPWDLIIAHPPCTYLSNAGACRMYPTKGVISQDRFQKAIAAKSFFMSFYQANTKFLAIENPLPLKVVDLPKPTQIIQPYQFGEPYTKKTLLWLKGLPHLKPTNILTEGVVPFVPSGTSRKLRGSSYGAAKRGNDSKNRSKFFPSIAFAMAEQWGAFL